MARNRPQEHVGTGRLTQFELYYRLRVAGLRVVPEYRIPTPRGACYADLALLGADDAPYALVECKARRLVLGARQTAKYADTGLPTCVATWATIDDAVRWCTDQARAAGELR